MRAARRRRARVLLCLLFGLVAGAAAGAGLVWFFHRNAIGPTHPDQADPALPRADELALVPADAVAFAHVRILDLWRTDQMAGFRKLVEKAGPEALKTFDDGFVPAPSTIDRATAVLLSVPDDRPGGAPRGGRSGPDWVVILAFSEPFNSDVVRKTNLPDAAEKKAGGKTYWHLDQTNPLTHEHADVALYFASGTVMVVGPGAGVEKFLARKPRPDGPLAPALALAAGGSRHLVGAVNLSYPALAEFIADGAKRLPRDLADLAAVAKADTLTISATVGTGLTLDVRASYKDAAAAADAEKALRDAAKKAKDSKSLQDARAEVKGLLDGSKNGRAPAPTGHRSIEDLPMAVVGLLGTGGLASLDEFLADPPLRREKGEVILTLDVGSMNPTSTAAVAGIGVGLMLPAVQKVREAAARTVSSNNLAQIGKAIHMYHDVNGHLPQDIKDKNGRPILSWRVAILPYIEQGALYNQFHRDEPWDSPHNAPLSRQVVKTFISPNAPQQTDAQGFALTSYQGVAGKGTVFDPQLGKVPLFVAMPDGTSNTVMVIEGPNPAPWAKPGDYVVDLSRPLPVKPTSPGMGNGLNVLMGDASVRMVDTATVSEKTLRLVFGRDDGQPIPSDW